MKDLKHLIYFENLLQEAQNELVTQAVNDGKIALGYNCYYIPEVLLNLPGCFSSRLRAPRCSSPDVATYYMTNRNCPYVRSILERGEKLHWRQLGVLGELVLLALVAFLPNRLDLLANSMISLACGFQVEAFRKIHGNAIATTMCIGNLRAGLHAAAEFAVSKKRADRNRAITYFTVILAFAMGAVVGNLAVQRWQNWAILGSSILLLACFGLMFFRAREEEGERQGQ